MLKRTGFKNRGVPLRKTPLNKVSKNKNVQKDKEEAKATRELDVEFYMGIWDDRPHSCYECNTHLYVDSFHAHHVLFKEKYPQYRYYENNIKLLCFRCHDQVHLDMKKTPRIYAYYLELMDKFINFE